MASLPCRRSLGSFGAIGGAARLFDAPDSVRDILQFHDELVDVESGDERERVEANVRRACALSGLEHQQASAQEDVADSSAREAHERSYVIPGPPVVVPPLVDAGVEIHAAQAINAAAD